MIVDVHCHLNHEQFKKDLDQVIERAKQAGVKAIVCSGINHPANEEVLEIAKKYDIVHASLGLYPIDLLGLGPDEVGITRQMGKIDLQEELDFIKKHKKDIVGIGECGLDYHWSKKPEEHKQQQKNFQKIIEFTEKIKLPLIVHSRRAEVDTFDLLESSKLKKEKVILHMFEARKHIIKKAIDNNYKFSIPTAIVKLQHFQTMAEIVPLQQLLTETDAPWLSPYPENRRNEPAFIVETIKKMAEIKKLPKEEIENQIYNNFKKTFL
ncbi:MAG: TatD family hydrolase [Nanoarchaeota archaeon]|nr:TatD family hydrolase [Nanoarchaeota archaeon]